MISQLLIAQALVEARVVLEHLRRANRYIDMRAGGNAQREIDQAIRRLEGGIRLAEQQQAPPAPPPRQAAVLPIRRRR